mgnify:CR=1 FL=1
MKGFLSIRHIEVRIREEIINSGSSTSRIGWICGQREGTEAGIRRQAVEQAVYTEYTESRREFVVCKVATCCQKEMMYQM